MTTALAANDPIESLAADAHNDLALAVASINAFGWRGKTVPAERKPGWRITEEDILRASFTVILVALLAMMGVSAGAILTMG
ncbi:hypothetical protein [Mycobacterium stomatepiae]|uniref:Uncharacterized protein n=1 Tax=Mycobacterium stomatepiae TaxID=470076 RepID=A0A7I7Q2L5_9MYCO|nr:hypothetical protein [Mycobacterium stomatepiae]MCV7165421.1 hypothetical protein [Mycobacterium stomatepiae]BBY20312.1 hypothetical protein MSTO_05170 [Mycobacterium stomatepiae]